MSKLVPNLPLLKNIPKSLLPKEITTIRLVEGGFNNKNVLINNSLLFKEFLVRDESNDPVSLRYRREKECLSVLAQNENIPQLLNFLEDSHHYFIIREWVDGSPLQIGDISSYITHITSALATIHSHSIPLSADFDYFDVIRHYLREYKKLLFPYSNSNSILSQLPLYSLLNRFFDNRFKQIQKIDSEKALGRIHGDLVLSNLILTKNKKKIVFIDWEYSTLADPLIDLAYLISQNNLPVQVQKTIIESYEVHLDFHIDHTKLRVYCDLMDLMSGLWYAIHAARLKLMPFSERKTHPPYQDFITLAIKTFHALNLG